SDDRGRRVGAHTKTTHGQASSRRLSQLIGAVLLLSFIPVASAPLAAQAPPKSIFDDNAPRTNAAGPKPLRPDDDRGFAPPAAKGPTTVPSGAGVATKKTPPAPMNPQVPT